MSTVSRPDQTEMPLTRENRQGIESLIWPCALHLLLSIFLFASLAAESGAQVPTSPPQPAKSEPAAIVDPLGRETPRGAVMGALKYAERQDFATVARYLQPPSGQDANLVQVAKEFQALHSRFKGNVDLLSDDPKGTVEAGLPPGKVRAGVISVGSTTVDFILVRVDDPEYGKDLADFARHGCENSRPLCPNAKRRADAGRTNGACRSQHSTCTWDVLSAMARVAALDPDLVVTGVAIAVSAQCAPAGLVQAPKAPFRTSLGDASWHAAQVHHCDPDSWRLRLLCLSRLFCIAATTFASWQPCSRDVSRGW